MENITDSLGFKSLLPLGTLFVCDAPRLNLDLEAEDGWRWLSFSYNMNLEYYQSFFEGPQSLTRIMIDLRYLIERLHSRATYKYFQLPNGESIVAIRVYVIPSDLIGTTQIQEMRWNFRRGQSNGWHLRRYRKIMVHLLSVLDFSSHAWNIKSLTDILKNPILLFSCLRPWEKFSSKLIGAGEYFNAGVLYYHVERLVNQEPFKAFTDFSITNNLVGKTVQETLLNIYDDIDISNSNNIKLSPILKNHDELSNLAASLFDNDVPGIKSTLYEYQKESVCEMLVREISPSKNLMPNLVEVPPKEIPSNNILKKKFYFDLMSLEFNIQAKTFDSMKGGILAENMGLGKTCICLTLVCLTKNQVSKIPEQFFPVYLEREANTLASKCAALLNRSSFPWSQYSDHLPQNCLKLLSEYPASFQIQQSLFSKRRYSERLAKGVSMDRTLFLCSTTLIVVPNNLYYQWISEINKHCYTESLRVLYVPYHTKTINVDFVFPEPEELIKYDIVLMGTSSFVKEFDEESPLKSVYWKRFIVDEGHSMSSRVNRLVQVAADLHAERRWLVSGTPTSGLTKLYVSENTSAVDQPIEEEFNDNDEDGENSHDYAIKTKFNAKDDLNRLGTIVANFFKLAPWSQDTTLFNQTIVKPFFSLTYGSLSSLHNLLSDLLVRHSMEVIEADIKLPPLSHKAVFLEPAAHNRLSVNLFVAVLAANAVTSERSDQDYMFHPSNKQSLKRLVTNFQRSTFHWVGFSIKDVETLISICETAINKKLETDSSQYHHPLQDRVLLTKCIDTAKEALDNKIWRTNSALHEMSYFIKGLPDIYAKKFSVDSLKDNKDITVYPFVHLNSIQSFYFKNRFITDEEKLEEKLSEHAKSFWENYLGKDKKSHKYIKSQQETEMIDLESTISSHKEQFKSPTKKKRRESLVGKNSSDISKVLKMNNYHNDTINDNMLSTRLAKVLGTLSSKLSYLASQLIQNHAMGIKSLVFYQFEDSAYYLVELLDLIGIPYILYSSATPVTQRNSKLVEFDQHKEGISLIMDLKLAAHGLTILAATRMYLINPVWKRAVEAQAIKRCHRIGQPKAVYVETLILKGTMEEEMYKLRNKESNTFEHGKKRRKKLIDEVETDTINNVYEDNSMKNYFERHEFIPRNSKLKEYCPFETSITEESSEIIIDALDVNNEDKTAVKEYIKDFEENDYQLLKVVGIIKNGIRHWDIPLFTTSAMELINETQTKVKRFIDEQSVIEGDVIGRKIFDSKHGNLTRLRNAMKDNKVNKQLRFVQ